jgi:hypothetical protein
MVPALALAFLLLFPVRPASGYGGSGGGGGSDGGGGGDVGGSNTSISDPMPIKELGILVDGPGPSTESVDPTQLSQETHEEEAEEKNEEDLDREISDVRIAFWGSLHWGATVLHEDVGWTIRLGLNFVPGVGWYTNAGLGALNTMVDTHVKKHGTVKEVLADGAISATVSSLVSFYGPGRNAAGALGEAAGVREGARFASLTITNVMTEQGINDVITAVRQAVDRQINAHAMVAIEEVSVTPGYSPTGGLGPEADLTGGVR